MLRAELKVIGGKQHGSLIPLQTKKFLVGREQDCQLRPTSESVSRHHCVFSIDDYGIRLRDLGSTNGTFVNGQRVQGQVVLQPNDRVLIGKLEFEIVIEGTAQAVQHARVASSFLTESGTGFLLSDLAEIPENSDVGNQTMLDVGPTEILGSFPEGGGETRILSADSTQVTSPKIPVVPQEAPITDDIPVLAPEVAEAAVPLAANQLVAPMQPVAPPMPSGMPMAPQAMQPPGMQPYGMPGMMPPGYPQPQYMQAPFANYAPQYMPSPYGMPQQPFMPQPYVDPAYQQQMAYQQQLAQQQMAQQHAMMAAQYAASPVPLVEEIEPEEESPVPMNATIVPPTRLPPPEETGVKAPPPPPPAVPAAEGQPPTAPQVKPNQLAADIIKKYMNRS